MERAPPGRVENAVQPLTETARVARRPDPRRLVAGSAEPGRGAAVELRSEPLGVPDGRTDGTRWGATFYIVKDAHELPRSR